MERKEKGSPEADGVREVIRINSKIDLSRIRLLGLDQGVVLATFPMEFRKLQLKGFIEVNFLGVKSHEITPPIMALGGTPEIQVRIDEETGELIPIVLPVVIRPVSTNISWAQAENIMMRMAYQDLSFLGRSQHTPFGPGFNQTPGQLTAQRWIRHPNASSIQELERGSLVLFRLDEKGEIFEDLTFTIQHCP